jgi:hypothetical protein
MIQSPIFASDPSSYKHAYEMESISTLFAIPLYEQTLLSSNTKNLQKAAVSRLFYLYKKHNKVIEALLLGSKYSHIISSKDKTSIWKSLTEIYKPVTYEHLTTAYVFALKANPENYTDFLRYLQEMREPRLFEFIYIVLYKRKQFELLKKLFEEDRSLTISPLYEGVVTIKLNPEKGREYLASINLEGEKDNGTKSDLLYLLGQYFRSLGENDISARYFRMSASFLWPDRGKLESAKSLVLSGKFSEACHTFQFSPSPNEEVSQIFYLVCVKKDKDFIREIKPSLKALGAKDGGEFFQKVNQSLERWE